MDNASLPDKNNPPPRPPRPTLAPLRAEIEASKAKLVIIEAMEHYKHTLDHTNLAVATVVRQVVKLTEVCTCGRGSEAEAVGIVTLQCLERMQALYLTMLDAMDELLDVGKISKKPVVPVEEPTWL